MVIIGLYFISLLCDEDNTIIDDGMFMPSNNSCVDKSNTFDEKKIVILITR